MQAGDKVRFKAGREGTFAPATELEVRSLAGEFAIFDIGNREWPILADRFEVVDD